MLDCHSRMLFARAYMRETSVDAHDRARLLKGTCTRGIYDT